MNTGKVPYSICWPESPDELNNFISPAPKAFHSKPMIVTAYDFDGDMIDSFEAPAGFQLDSWVRYIHDGYDVTFQIKARPGGIDVSVFPSGNRHLLYKYSGLTKE